MAKEKKTGFRPNSQMKITLVFKLAFLDAKQWNKSCIDIKTINFQFSIDEKLKSL